MIRVDNLTKIFAAPRGGEVQALAGITLWIDRGESVAVGAGPPPPGFPARSARASRTASPSWPRWLR
jgi:hypothetical protein